MLYKYEMHCHSSECSACAVNTSVEMVQAYNSAGYAGMVLTDHFVRGNTAVPRNLPWDTRMRMYYESYLLAKAEGDRLNFDVIFGLEHGYGGGKEVLVYGTDLEFLLKNPDIETISIEEFSKRVHNAGGFVAQAHPYRVRPYIKTDVLPKPHILDGVEVFNLGNAPEDNIPAMELALSYDLVQISGSDAHSIKRAGLAGMAFPYRIRTGDELVTALKNRDGKLIVNGEILTD